MTRLILLFALILAGCEEAKTVPDPVPVDIYPEPIPTVSVMESDPIPPLEPSPVCHEDRMQDERDQQAVILRRNHIPFADSTEGLHFRIVKGDLMKMEFYDHVAYLMSLARLSIEQRRCDGLPPSL